MSFENKNIKYHKLLTNKYNLGLGILKVILAFKVIIHHNFNQANVSNKILLFFFHKTLLHVPSFFIMSFYFTHQEFLIIVKLLKDLKDSLFLI